MTPGGQGTGSSRPAVGGRGVQGVVDTGGTGSWGRQPAPPLLPGTLKFLMSLSYREMKQGGEEKRGPSEAAQAERRGVRNAQRHGEAQEAGRSQPPRGRPREIREPHPPGPGPGNPETTDVSSTEARGREP